MPPARGRKLGKLATRACILEVAKQQLERPGSDGTSIRDLAQAAGVAELELSSACNHCPLFTGRFREQLAGRLHTFLGAPAAAQLV